MLETGTQSTSPVWAAGSRLLESPSTMSQQSQEWGLGESPGLALECRHANQWVTKPPWVLDPTQRGVAVSGACLCTPLCSWEPGGQGPWLFRVGGCPLLM